MRGHYEEIKELGAEVLTVWRAPLEELHRYKMKAGVPFLMLSDEQGTVTEKYEVKNNWDLIHRGVPHPATYIIGREGIVRFAEVRQNFLVRIKPATILEELRNLSAARETPQRSQGAPEL